MYIADKFLKAMRKPVQFTTLFVQIHLIVFGLDYSILLGILYALWLYMAIAAQKVQACFWRLSQGIVGKVSHH